MRQVVGGVLKLIGKDLLSLTNASKKGNVNSIERSSLSVAGSLLELPKLPERERERERRTRREVPERTRTESKDFWNPKEVSNV